MIPVIIEYKPVPFLSWKSKIEAQMPARWNDLSQRQLELAPYLKDDEADEKKVLQIFLDIPRRVAKRLDSYQAFCITRNLRFLHRAEPVSRFVIRKIAGYKGPGDKLHGVTFGAFIFGDTYFQEYIAGKKEYLDLFIACYYLGDGKFDEKDVGRRARAISRKGIKTREAIALNYLMIREWLGRVYQNVFEKREITDGKRDAGWLAVHDRLVGDDLTKQDAWATLPVSTVLRHLNRKIKEVQKYGS